MPTPDDLTDSQEGSAEDRSGDWIRRFYFEAFNARGQIVQLDATLAELLARRDYPAAVLELLGQMLAAVAMIADGLKWPGSVALQSKGGALRTTLAEHRPGGLMRAIARPVDEDDWTSIQRASSADLIGDGQLALSLIPADDDRTSQPYQGMVAWEHDGLAANLATYFRASEQLDTRFLLFADRKRARGLLLQRLPGTERDTFVDEETQDSFWRRACERVERAAPESLAFESASRFLNSLFREETLTLAPSTPLSFACTCSREKTGGVLRMLGRDDILELLAERGDIEVTCEFCGLRYHYSSSDTLELLDETLTRH
ncbi:MAG: Hsp33 family molecular chaperone HslO [Pseudomonadota bacterium]